MRDAGNTLEKPPYPCETSSGFSKELYDAQPDNYLTMINELALEAALRASVTSRKRMSRLSPEIARIYVRSLFDHGALRHSRARYRANLSQDFSAAKTATESSRLQRKSHANQNQQGRWTWYPSKAPSGSEVRNSVSPVK
jgi:hypothetical protein